MAQFPQSSRPVLLAQAVDNATDFTDLKRRVRDALIAIEQELSSSTSLHFVDKQTDTNPNQYAPGDIVVDTTIVDNAIVIYAYDVKKNKIPLSFKSLGGSLPVSINEIFIGDGTNTTFNTQATFISKSTQVYKAGLRQRINTDYLEGSNRKQIIFSGAPPNGTVIIADYEMVLSL